MDDNPSTGVESLTAGLDELASYLEGSTIVVQAYTDIIERKYARPALDKISRYFQGQPLTMIWVTITLALFAVMSILPVLSFIGLSIFAVCSCMSIALAFALAAAVAFEIVFTMVLLSVLGGLLLFSSVITTFGAMAYLTFCLVQHFQTHGRFRIAEWVQEAKQHFTSVSAKPEDNDDSDGSGVLIAHEANGAVKRESRSPSPSRYLLTSGSN
ncbi:uncharacterized protein EDB93DRAFT_1245215 [Suillus bovinus]|uniref:uncharacterized protein n=1 Tax=Suillus bovinus TaxID=48563 RepID=UPI001B877231|nr:uncharacterized protein EDB93DRAFT_1245215 [Suillus bovinus]KAG2159420.1 hypothetical protein EDB93DRAFT_1245215 [Suillus bovinus]